MRNFKKSLSTRFISLLLPPHRHSFSTFDWQSPDLRRSRVVALSATSPDEVQASHLVREDRRFFRTCGVSSHSDPMHVSLGRHPTANLAKPRNMRLTHLLKLLKSFSGLWLLAAIYSPVHGETFQVPLTQTNGWQFLKYSNIPPNTFQGTQSGFRIGVAHSASPIVLPLPKSLSVAELKVRGQISGTLHIPPGRQGMKDFDDYTVRIGLVVPGARTLNWAERLIAADWVRKLYALAPNGTGISRIHFFNVGTETIQIGRTRIHPLSDLMQETVAAVPDAEGRFAFSKPFNNPLDVVAIWISCDGDDTQSSFTVTLDQIDLEYTNPPPKK